MRLGQLARKLAIPPSEISDFLTSQGMPSLEGSNARLSDEQLSIVLQRFAPAGLAEEIVKSEEIVKRDEISEPETPLQGVAEAAEAAVVASMAESAQEVNETLEEPVQPSPVETSEDGSEGKVETIKAQKVSLSGLKVLGKIELPDPKKKIAEAPAEKSDEATDSKPAENNRPPFEKKRPQQFKKDRREQRQSKNPIALAREREAQAAEEKRQEEAKRKKELRTLNYQKRVKTATPTKAARIIDEDVVKMSDSDLRPEPTTWLGRFWRWFTT